MCKVNWDKPIVTNDGCPARVICRDMRQLSTPTKTCIVVLVEVAPGSETAWFVDENGCVPGMRRIFNIKEKKKFYIHLVRSKTTDALSALCYTDRQGPGAFVGELLEIKEVEFEV